MSYKTKEPKQDSQNQLRSPTSEGGEYMTLSNDSLSD
jgi:hypothetical protein